MPDNENTTNEHEAPLVRGVYSTQVVKNSDAWSASGKTVKKTYWYVEQVAENAFLVRPLADNHSPAGQPRLINRDDFLKDYTPEMDYYLRNVLPVLNRLEEHLERADKLRKRKEHYSAEAEYHFARGIDEQSVRAAFGLGFIHLERGDEAKARQIFEQLVNMEAPFAPEHKHLFNDFGIALRKNRMFKEALHYYFRAVDLASDDENLFFNIARSYYEMGDFKHCIEYLAVCLKLNRGVEQAQKFCRHIIREHEEQLAKKDRKDPDVHFQLIHEATRILDALTRAAGMSEDDVGALRQKVRKREEREEERRRKEKEREKAKFDLRLGSPYNMPDFMVDDSHKNVSRENLDLDDRPGHQPQKPTKAERIRKPDRAPGDAPPEEPKDPEPGDPRPGSEHDPA
ncbi:MAG: tetratricopeptide repeat protein [Desulfovibrionaceae bacterium]